MNFFLVESMVKAKLFCIGDPTFKVEPPAPEVESILARIGIIDQNWTILLSSKRDKFCQVA